MREPLRAKRLPRTRETYAESGDIAGLWNDNWIRVRNRTDVPEHFVII